MQRRGTPLLLAPPSPSPALLAYPYGRPKLLTPPPAAVAVAMAKLLLVPVCARWVSDHSGSGSVG